MTIAAFPTALQPAIQKNFLDREFKTGLESVAVYRSVADQEIFPANIGETVTKTRKGLKAPVTTPLNPSNNTGLDNGLTPTTWTLEQYNLGVDMYGDTIDLNMVTQRVGIEDQFLHNAYTNGVQSAQSIDRLARNALNAAYMSGNSRVKVALGAANATIQVDDIRGFTSTIVNGAVTPIGSGVTMSVQVGSNIYTLQSFTIDGSNSSSIAALGGVSGTLTFATQVSVGDGALNSPVVGAYAPTILRPNARSTTAGVLSTDLFSMSIALDAVTQLRNNAVPQIAGRYNCYLDNTSARQLFADPDFKLLYQGSNAATEFSNARVVELLDLRFLPTTEAIQQTNGNVKVRRPIVVGAGALVEGVFEDTAYSNVAQKNAIVNVIDGVAMVTRPPMDRLAQVVGQSWYYIGGFSVPTDVTANQTIIPTASNAMFKRAVMIEHGS